MVKGLYALYDLVANDVVGNVVTLHAADPPAIRQFRDLMARDDFAGHVGDYALVRLGYVNLGTLDVLDVCTQDRPVAEFPHRAVVVTGAQLVAKPEAANGQ